MKELYDLNELSLFLNSNPLANTLHYQTLPHISSCWYSELTLISLSQDTIDTLRFDRIQNSSCLQPGPMSHTNWMFLSLQLEGDVLDSKMDHSNDLLVFLEKFVSLFHENDINVGF